MNIFQVIKSLFKAQSQSKSAGALAFDDSAVGHYTQMALFTTYSTEHLTGMEEKSKKLLEHFGDFYTFLCMPDFDKFVREEILLFREPAGQHLTFLDKDHWTEKHPFNFPGPFYSGASDTCGMGVWEAPKNVMNDANCCEYVFKQPTNYHELLCVLDAAAVEVFDSYSSNGNNYWTYELCKNWWRNKDQLLNNLTCAEVAKMNNGQERLYIEYLHRLAKIDLRRYCYFLETGVFPQGDNIVLPKL